MIPNSTFISIKERTFFGSKPLIIGDEISFRLKTILSAFLARNMAVRSMRKDMAPSTTIYWPQKISKPEVISRNWVAHNERGEPIK